MKNARILVGLFALVSLFYLAGCSAESPELIAAHPAEIAIATYPQVPPPEPNLMVVYNANLVMAVSNVDRAAEEAAGIAYDYGGYLVSSQSWYQDDDKHTTLILAVPVSRFESARRSLLNLGTLVSERVSGELTAYGGEDWRTFSHITLNLRPKAFALPSMNLPTWRPLRTLVNAWGVFISIFGFLTDIVIWVVVVAGPFVLMAWGLRALLKRKSKES
jgi:hypothetical protein